jgi:7-carboxy-7-deazaguanine synthase
VVEPGSPDRRDEIKFVIASRGDYEWARDVIRERSASTEGVQEGTLRALLISPGVGKMDFRSWPSGCWRTGLPVRYQIQLHKIIWGANVPGRLSRERDAGGRAARG